MAKTFFGKFGILSITLALICVLGFTSCSDDENTSIALKTDITALELSAGESQTIAITEGNGGYSIAELTIESKAVLQVTNVENDKFTVKALAYGNGTVVVKDQAGKQVTIPVKIKSSDLKPSKTVVEIGIGQTEIISITGNGGYSIADLSEESKKIIEVSTIQVDQFTIKALAQGDASIVVKDITGKEVTITVSVKEMELQTDSKVLRVVVGKSETVTITQGNGGYTMDELSWLTKTVIEVSAIENNKFTVKGLKQGNVSITLRDSMGKVASILVRVSENETEGLEQIIVGKYVGNFRLNTND